MKEYADALEKNLKEKSDLLGSIYECNDRLRMNLDSEKTDYEDYDSYISEKEELLEELDRVETDTDIIIDRIKAKGLSLKELDTAQRNRINALLSEISGRTEAVRDIESKVKKLTDSFFQSKRSEISATRKQIKTLQTHYGSNSFIGADGAASFDIKN